MISTEFKSAPSLWFDQLKLNLILSQILHGVWYRYINQDRHRTISLILISIDKLILLMIWWRQGSDHHYFVLLTVQWCPKYVGVFWENVPDECV